MFQVGWLKLTMTKALFLSFFIIVIASGDSLAHRLNVFAWVEGGQVVARCNFGSKRPAVNAEVKAYTGGGNDLLAQGQTNELGEFAFPLPANIAEGIKIEASAGQGHKGEWILDAPKPSPAATVESEASAPPLTRTPRSNPTSSPAASITREELESILSRSLAPLHREIAELRQGKPGAAEIVGGVGWLIGLAGICFYFMARTKK